MYEVLMVIGGFYQTYRAFNDAGGWMLMFDNHQRAAYLEALAINRGLM